MKIEEIALKAEKRGAWEISFNLDFAKLKPVFISMPNSSNADFVCMLDSGAGIPVWCSGEESLLQTFPKAVLKADAKSLLSGFGAGFEISDVYYIPEVEICNGKNSVVFKNFYLPVVDRRTFGTDLILPSAMLKDSNIFLSQMETYHEKELVIQCHALYFETRYTTRRLSVKAIAILQEKCKDRGITLDTSLIGGEGEFYKVLVQDDKVSILEENYIITQKNERSEENILEQ